MWIDEIVNYHLEIEECFSVFKTAEVSHGLDAVFYVLVVSFDMIIIVFEPMFLEFDRYAELEFGDVKE